MANRKLFVLFAHLYVDKGATSFKTASTAVLSPEQFDVENSALQTSMDQVCVAFDVNDSDDLDCEILGDYFRYAKRLGILSEAIELVKKHGCSHVVSKIDSILKDLN